MFSSVIFRRIQPARLLSFSPKNLRKISLSTKNFDSEIIDPPDTLELIHSNYERRRNDPYEIKKARLIYQSRKRGNLENGLLLGSFAEEYLPKLTEEQIDEYDKLINLPSNDWDIFYWTLGMKPVPDEFNNSVMDLLKVHIKQLNKKIDVTPTYTGY